MSKSNRMHAAGLAIALGCLIIAGPSAAQTKSKPTIVCWKDKSGRIVGCGDTVPPEYRNSGTRELDARGVTRKTTESAAEEARRRAQEQQAQRDGESKTDDAKRLEERKRQDAALIATYANEGEIDSKRDRDLADNEAQLTQMRASLKVSANRLEQAKKGNNKDEVARAEADKMRVEKSIAAKEQEKEEIRKKYAEQKARYQELKGSGQPAVPATAAKK